MLSLEPSGFEVCLGVVEADRGTNRLMKFSSLSLILFLKPDKRITSETSPKLANDKGRGRFAFAQYIFLAISCAQLQTECLVLIEPLTTICHTDIIPMPSTLKCFWKQTIHLKIEKSASPLTKLPDYFIKHQWISNTESIVSNKSIALPGGMKLARLQRKQMNYTKE